MENVETPKVVIVGGGFGGLCAAQELCGSDLAVTLVDRRNHHLFQPLLYQVATGGLSPANIASPLRSVLGRCRHVRVLRGEVTGFDLTGRRVLLADGVLPYDHLIVAAGARTSYFGHEEWRRLAPGLKSIEDATEMRRRVLSAFERAEREEDAGRRAELLTFVVVGGGPTGVELAGALAEVSHRTLAGEFRAIDPADARILLVEALDRVLTPFPEKLSRRAARDLERLGVELKLGWRIEELHEEGVVIQRTEGDERETIATDTVLWGAGVGASPLGASLALEAGVETDRGGRVPVGDDCSLPGHPEVFVIGDLARFEEGLDASLPGLAPVAMQQGRYVGRLLRARGRDRERRPFRYRDKGMMATIGRKLAVAKIGRFGFGGLAAWLTWLFVHLMYLTEFENRVLVLLQWAWNYITRNRSARLITGEERPPE